MTDAVPNYAELPLGRFVDMVASREPAPGGGASAAVAIALAAALTAMAARFSADNLADAETIADRAEELRNKVMPLAQADAAAYGRVLDAYRTPRDDDEKRRRRIREALSEAADVPLSIAEVGVEVVGNAARLVEEGNPNLRGDAMTAAALAKAGVRAAATLVEINVSAGGADDDRLSRVDQLLATMAAAQEVVEGAEARSWG
ncbi:MAG TPA: cyclodeaminase/cyclohydrolase family protein [Rubrobacter sp.]|jgi:formiminotetrahydrofolate cyclodeaminase|nr:cyclodeaminase/cyclohydrolase family protein [Rubrobacter sp.]